MSLLADAGWLHGFVIRETLQQTLTMARAVLAVLEQQANGDSYCKITIDVFNCKST